MPLNTHSEIYNRSLAGQSPASLFFVAGGTLSRDAACYVTRQADTELLSGLRAGQFCYVLTSRQMGKSSLMVRAATHLRQEGVAVAVLDLTAIGQNLTPEQWYDGLLNRIGRQLHLEDATDDFWQEHERVAPMQRFFRGLLEVVLPRTPGNIVIFIDEIDAVRSLPFPTDEFFAGIRECYNSRGEEPELRRLTFALFGVASPSDLIRDVRTTPFNIGKRIELKDFTRAEARPLGAGFTPVENDKVDAGHASNLAVHQASGSPPDASALVNAHLLQRASTPKTASASAQRILDRILYWTDGHPYLTLKLCQVMAEQCASTPQALTTKDVDAHCEELFLSPRARERDDNLLFVRERLLRSEVDLAGLLDLYAHIRAGQRIPDEENNSLVDVLRLSGIVRSEHGVLQVRNRIYAHVFDRAWVVANMPDAEMRRQRTAYRRGLMRALALSSLVLLAMGILTGYAIKRERDARDAEADAKFSEQKARDARDRANIEKAHADIEKAKAENATSKEREAKNAAEKARVNMQSSAMQERRAKEAAQSASEIAMKALKKSKTDEAEAQRQRQSALAYARTAKQESQRANRNEQAERAQKERIQRLSYADTMNRASKALAGLSPADASNYLERYAHPEDAGKDLRDFIWRYLKRQCMGGGQRTYKGHEDGIGSLAISPDGKLLASASNDHVVRLRELQANKLLPTPSLSHGNNPTQVSFSPDGRLLAISDQSKILLWDLAQARLQDTLLTANSQGHFLGITSLAFSADSKLLAVGAHTGSIDLWNMATHQKIKRLLHHPKGDDDPHENYHPVEALAFSPDASRLASSARDPHGRENTTKLWEVGSGRELCTLGEADRRRIQSSRTYALAFSPDGKFLVTGGQDHWVRVWNLANIMQPSYQELPRHDNEVMGVAFSKDGRWLATCSRDGGIKMWDASEMAAGGRPREVTTMHGHDKAVTCVAFTPDSRRLVSGSLDRTLKVWDVASSLPGMLTAQQSPIDTLAYSSDSKLLLTGGTYQGDAIRLWNTRTLTVKSSIPTKNGGVCAAFAPDGKSFVVADFDGSLTLYESDTGSKIATFQQNTPFKNYAEHFLAIAWSSDGKMIATGGSSDDHYPRSGYHPRLWDVATRREIPAFMRMQSHFGWILALAFSPDSKTLVTGGGGGEIRWWDVTTLKEIGKPPRVSNSVPVRAEFPHQGDLQKLTFSHDGKWLVSGSDDNTLLLWNAPARKPVSKLLGHINIVYAAAFSPDDKTLATGDRSGVVKLWSLAALALPNEKDQEVLDAITLSNDQGGLRALAFSPDGKTLAAGLLSGRVRFWQAEAPTSVSGRPNMRDKIAMRYSR